MKLSDLLPLQYPPTSTPGSQKNYLQLYGQNLYMSLNKRFKRTAKIIARCKHAHECKHLTCWLKDYKTEVTVSLVTLRIILHTLHCSC